MSMEARDALMVASDYAVLRLPGDVRLYYGYEVTSPPFDVDSDEEREWCFEAKWPGVTVTIPSSMLGMPRQEDDMGMYLLLGISALMERGYLKIASPPPTETGPMRTRCRARFYGQEGWLTCTRRAGHTKGHRDRIAGEWWILDAAMDAVVRAGGVPLTERTDR